MTSDQQTARGKTGPWIALCLIIALAGGLRFYGLESKALFGDEAFSHWTADGSLRQTLVMSVGERTPPLTGILLHYWLQVTPRNSVFWFRFPFVILNLMAMLPLFAIGIAVAGEKEALIACGIYSVSPHMIDMAQFARYPSIQILFYALAVMFYLQYRATGKVGRLVGLTVCMAVTFYLNYFAFVIAGAFAISVILFDREKPRWKSVVAFVVSFALFLPWAPNFVGRASSELGFKGISGVVGYLKTMPLFSVPHAIQVLLIGRWPVETESKILFGLLAFSAGAVFVWFLMQYRKNQNVFFLACALILPMVGAVLLKTLVDFPVVTFPRIYSPLAPLLYICLAIGLTSMPKSIAIAVGVVIAFAIGASLTAFVTSLNVQNTNDAMRTVTRMKKTGDVIITSPFQCDSLVHFFGLYDMPRIGMPAPMDPLNYNAATTNDYVPVNSRRIGEMGRELRKYRRAWVFWCGGPRPGLDPDGRVIKFMDEAYRMKLSMDFAFWPWQTAKGAGLLRLYELKPVMRNSKK